MKIPEITQFNKKPTRIHVGEWKLTIKDSTFKTVTIENFVLEMEHADDTPIILPKLEPDNVDEFLKKYFNGVYGDTYIGHKTTDYTLSHIPAESARIEGRLMRFS